MLRVAIVASNYARVSSTTQKGTEFLLHVYLTELKRQLGNSSDIAVTVFASGDSDVPFPLVALDGGATAESPSLTPAEQKDQERALLSKAFSMKNQFDLYHVHISNGQDVLPFAKQTTKPILFTMYGGFSDEAGKNTLKAFVTIPNAWFVSVVAGQRHTLPFLRYAATIPHGLNLTHYRFDQHGGQHMLWAGRGMPEKGPDVAVELAQQIGKPVKLFPVMRAESHAWFETHVGKKARKSPTLVTIGPALSRQELALEYPKSKLFLFPLSWDEPFGMVIVESLASGTPVIAYARGSTSDMIDDGKTGLLVDPSRGLAGLVKAVEHIYALSIAEYELMRKACRVYAEEQFSIHKTVQSYTKLYRSLSIS